jgi:acetyl esterase/lipase
MWINETVVAWLFLGVSLVGAVFTVNAFMPVRRIPALFVPSFFGSWLTAELALHHIVWQSIATVLFVQFGALSVWPGLIGLGITFVSWLGLLSLFHSGHQTRGTFEAVLSGLPELDDADRIPLGRLLVPFRHHRHGVRVVRDITYRQIAGKKLRLDVAMPEEPGTNRPAIIQIHGGGWIIGDKREQGWPLIGHLAANGWVCFNVNYRLSPAATWPEHLVDLKYALKWIRERADEYGIDPNFVAVTGGSAGGHLTAMMALTENEPEYQPGFEDADTTVQAAVPVYGVYDFTNRLGSMQERFLPRVLEPMIMKAFLQQEPEKFHRASPMDRIHPNAPPFLIVHGDRDTLAPVEDAQVFADDLRRTSRSPVMYTELRGAQHAFDVFASPRTARMLDGTLRFLTAMHERAEGANASRPTEGFAAPTSEPAPEPTFAADHL